MTHDDELDDDLAQLGLPAGSAPRGDAASILARARALAPPPRSAPRWTPLKGAGLLAAGVVIGIAVGRATAPSVVVVEVDRDPPSGVAATSDGGGGRSEEAGGPSAEVVEEVALPPPLREAGPRSAGGGRPHGRRGVGELAQVVTAPVLPPTAAECAAMLSDAPAKKEDRPQVRQATASPDESLAALLAEEDPVPALPDDLFDTAPDPPGPGDRRLQRPERTARSEELPEVVEESAPARVPGGSPSPFTARIVATAGDGPAVEVGPGSALLGGLAWRPNGGGTRPEVLADVGLGAFADPEGLDWALNARLGAGVLIGDGWLHGAADWTVSAALRLDDHAESPVSSSREPNLFATGPSLALVVGQEDRLHARAGAYLDFAPLDPVDAPGGWRLQPTAFVALELPLGGGESD